MQSKRGDANVYNTVDGVNARVFNVIDFLGNENATGPPVLEQVSSGMSRARIVTHKAL